MTDDAIIIDAYRSFLSNKSFPCIAARASVAASHVRCLVAGSMACPKDDAAILNFLYQFVDDYRHSKELFHSAAVIFKAPQPTNEEQFDSLMWQRLQALADLDAANFRYDPRVEAAPDSARFSFSLKEESFFVLGLHPGSSRLSRQFGYPALAFNPHAEFEKLRDAHHYEQMKNVVRKRDLAYSGSVNPMLDDFGETSEVYQYSGRKYSEDWQCPLQINHATTKHHPPA
jgi:FPC/CPF motif-containing protein YcgG